MTPVSTIQYDNDRTRIQWPWLRGKWGRLANRKQDTQNKSFDVSSSSNVNHASKVLQHFCVRLSSRLPMYCCLSSNFVVLSYAPTKRPYIVGKTNDHPAKHKTHNNNEYHSSKDENRMLALSGVPCGTTNTFFANSGARQTSRRSQQRRVRSGATAKNEA